MTTHTTIGSRRLLMTLAMATAAVLLMAAPTRGQELGERCTNPDDGYTVEFPTDWYVNGHVEGGESEDVAACRFFSPEDFHVTPASQAAGIAVAIGVQQDGPVESGEPTTVGGRPAIRVESVSETDGVDPAGTRSYSYWIELTDGTWLVASTSDGPNWVGDYEENSAVLDGMMESLTFEAASMPDTAIGTGSPAAVTPLAAAGIILVGLALAASRLRAAQSVT